MRDNSVVFVGDSYVHGLMDGEMIAAGGGKQGLQDKMPGASIEREVLDKLTQRQKKQSRNKLKMDKEKTDWFRDELIHPKRCLKTNEPDPETRTVVPSNLQSWQAKGSPPSTSSREEFSIDIPAEVREQFMNEVEASMLKRPPQSATDPKYSSFNSHAQGFSITELSRSHAPPLHIYFSLLLGQLYPSVRSRCICFATHSWPP